MPTPIQIQATKLEIPFVLSQFENKKAEIASVVASLGLTFENKQGLYDALIALGIETVAEGFNYDSIDVSKGAAAAPVTLKVTEQPKIGLSVDTSAGTALVAVEQTPSLSVSIQESQAVEVQTKKKLSVSIVDPNQYVNTQPDRTLVLTSNDGSRFIVAVGNDGTLAAIPPTSTAPSITTLPTISGTLNVGETLTATPGTVTGEPTPTQVLQWQRSDNGTTGWSNIAGATGTTYLLGSLDENKYIRVQQTEENVLGTATANSASTGQIQPLSFAYLLNDYGGAAAAYSLRKLSSTYSGDAIVVRRTSDNTTQSIGFVNNELDTATLESFCSGTDGFVTTWYDQSGNGFDITQSTAFKQPKIVSAGSTITDGTKPSVQFLEAQGLNTTANISSASNYYPFYVRSIAGTSGSYIWDSQVGRVLIERTFVAAYYDQTNGFEGSPLTISYRLIHMELNSTTGGKVYENGVITQTGLSYTQYPMSGETALGARYDVGSAYLNGKIQEFVLYNTDQSTNRTGIETNINDFYNIY